MFRFALGAFTALIGIAAVASPGPYAGEQARPIKALSAQQAARESLAAGLARIARLQAELRRVHLQAHVDQVALLEPAQIEKYAQLRGYRPDSASMDHQETPTSHH